MHPHILSSIHISYVCTSTCTHMHVCTNACIYIYCRLLLQQAVLALSRCDREYALGWSITLLDWILITQGCMARGAPLVLQHTTRSRRPAPPRPHRPPQRRPPGRCRHRCIQPWPLPLRPPRARHTPSRAPVPSAGLAAVLLLLLLLARAAKITARAWCRPLHRPPPIRPPPPPPQPRPPPPPPPRHHPRSRDRRRPMSRRTLTPHGGA